MYTSKQTDGPWHHMTPSGCWFLWSTFSSSGRKQNNNQNSDWQWQALPAALSLIMTSSGRKNTRTRTQGDINDATQCKYNLLANKQSALLFPFFFSFIFFSLHLWVFPKSHVGLIWLIALPDIHRATGSGEIEENKSWENMSLTFEFTLWVHISFLHSTPSSICLPPSLSISPSVSLSLYLGLFSCI